MTEKRMMFWALLMFTAAFCLVLWFFSDGPHWVGMLFGAVYGYSTGTLARNLWQTGA